MAFILDCVKSLLAIMDGKMRLGRTIMQLRIQGEHSIAAIRQALYELLAQAESD